MPAKQRSLQQRKEYLDQRPYYERPKVRETYETALQVLYQLCLDGDGEHIGSTSNVGLERRALGMVIVKMVERNSWLLAPEQNKPRRS